MAELDIHPLQLTAGEVARMTRPQRERRVESLIGRSFEIAEQALAVHLEGHELVGRVLLFSGGNDSTVLSYLFRDWATHAGHANTTIGAEFTRQFVRDSCAAWGLPLLERRPERSFDELVMEQGFPGPAQHFKMYQRLKERALRQIRRELVLNGRRQRMLYLAGRRRDESRRRADVPLFERVYSEIWASPMAEWTKFDLNMFRLMCGGAIPENDLADMLHMSCECLCGAFAKPGELAMLESLGAPWTAPSVQQIRRLEDWWARQPLRIQVAKTRRVYRGRFGWREEPLPVWRAHPVPLERRRWGWGAYRSMADRAAAQHGPLCQSCAAD